MRKSKKIVQAISQNQFEESLTEYAIASAKHSSLTAKMEEAITKIRDKYAPELNKLNDIKEQNFEVVQTYCLENPALFNDKKSLDTVHGKVGFRTGTPALKPAKGYTWASVLNLIKALAPGYVRTKEELNKEQLLADRNKPEVFAKYPEYGVQVVQDESFYIELKKEETEAVTA